MFKPSNFNVFTLFLALSLVANFTNSLLFAQTTTEKATESAEKTDEPAKGEWIQLFNGKDLEGWTPKITGYELGDNFGDTFRVEDGLLKVRYDQYKQFRKEEGGERFGHIFYKQPYSNYIMRLEYRFVGEQIKGGPGWAVRNSGVMIHGQDPTTMTKDQKFPVSIEVQLLGGDGTNPRNTLNLCTPGTNVVMNNELVRRHCTSSSSKTYHGEQWVTCEIEVRGNEVIRHKIDGKTVLEYNKPQLDDRDPEAKLFVKDGNLMLSGGSISLQSESHPCDFRKVEIMVLDADKKDDSGNDK